MHNTLTLRRTWLVLPAMVLALTACTDNTSFDFDTSRDEFETQVANAAAPQALFDPSDLLNPVIPFPNNLLFLGSEDGTLNIPIGADADQTLANPLVALNQQDGFSTTSPISTAVSEALDEDTLTLGVTVRVFEVTTADEGLPIEGTTVEQRTLARSAITSSIGEIIDPAELVIAENDNQLILIPNVPLAPSTSYMVVLTNGIEDSDGNALEPSFAYGLFKGDEQLRGETDAQTAQLEGLRSVIGSHTAVLNAQLGVDPESVVLSWVFTTQSTNDVLAAVKDVSDASGSLVLVDSATTTADIPISETLTLGGQADIYVGAISLPYYQTAITAEDVDPSPALNGFWRNAAGQVPGATDENGDADYLPIATENVSVPVILTIPNDEAEEGGEMPAAGWPVTVFQHGITRSRTDMLLIADAMADEGRAVIAIDMPLHGVESTSAVHASNNPLVSIERTFDIDAVSQDPDTGEVTLLPDGVTDSSGTHFYNLANLANSRDNLRQAVADLFVLSASLSSAAILDTTQMPQGVTLDASNLTFVGHSLGAIVGSTMLAFDNTFEAATLAMPGGGIARLLAGSDNIGPQIESGLAGAGIDAESAAFQQFLTAAQTMIDSGDPINHASTLAASDTRIHLIEVIGDATVPNSVDGALLSGTEPLIRLLDLPAVDATVMDSNAAVRFTEGTHSSIINPADGAAYLEMQSQMASFAFNRGQTLEVTNSEVLQSIDAAQ